MDPDPESFLPLDPRSEMEECNTVFKMPQNQFCLGFDRITNVTDLKDPKPERWSERDGIQYLDMAQTKALKKDF
jgi:hypothetical protein